MSNASDFEAFRFPGRAVRKFALSLLIALPIFALCLAHSLATSGASSVENPEFGYAEWAAK